jgi:anaerobic magnesium-protoporphyrin IX monomethyl ester cyclase
MSVNKKLVFIVGGSSSQAYQLLANNYSAIEPSPWALLLAGAARSWGYEPKLIDLDAQPMSREEIAKEVGEINPLLAVFVVYGQNPNAGTTSMIGATRTARDLNEDVPSTKIVFIGSHPSALPLEVISLPFVDFVFINEGVIGLRELVKTDFKNELSSIPGLWFKDKEGNPCKGSRGVLVDSAHMDLELPGYAWDLLPKKTDPLDLYRAHFWHTNFQDLNRTPFASIYTSLGCQFACNFCMINIVNRVSHDNSVTAADSRGMRFWSPNWVLNELRILAGLGVKSLRISDEMFFLNRKYYIPILEGIIRESFDFNLWAYARVDSVRPDQLELFKAAGVNWLCLGIEAGNTKVRIEIDKGRFRQVDIREVVASIKAAGINVLGNYMFGFPEETIETMTETLDLALELNCEHSNFYAATALPGSPLYDYARTQGWDLPSNYEEFAFLSYQSKPLRTRSLSAKDVLQFRDHAWKTYFSSPRYLNLVNDKFGTEARVNVQKMASIRLKRKLLGD